MIFLKQIIAGIFLLILFTAIMVQSPLEVANDNRLNKFDEIVNRSVQQARFDGYFTTANINTLRSNLKTAFSDLTDADITINVTTTPKYRKETFDYREMIDYDISIPVRKIVAAGALFGISDTDNQYRRQRTGSVTSELVMP